DALAPGQCASQRGRDGLRPIVGAQLAPGDPAEPLGYVANGDGDDGEVAGEGFFDGVGRAFLRRRKDEDVARGHVVRDLRVWYLPADDQARPRRGREQLDRALREAV